MSRLSALLTTALVSCAASGSGPDADTPQTDTGTVSPFCGPDEPEGGPSCCTEGRATRPLDYTPYEWEAPVEERVDWFNGSYTCTPELDGVGYPFTLRVSPQPSDELDVYGATIANKPDFCRELVDVDVMLTFDSELLAGTLLGEASLYSTRDDGDYIGLVDTRLFAANYTGIISEQFLDYKAQTTAEELPRIAIWTRDDFTAPAPVFTIRIGYDPLDFELLFDCSKS